MGDFPVRMGWLISLGCGVEVWLISVDAGGLISLGGWSGRVADFPIGAGWLISMWG